MKFLGRTTIVALGIGLGTLAREAEDHFYPKPDTSTPASSRPRDASEKQPIDISPGTSTRQPAVPPSI